MYRNWLPSLAAGLVLAATPGLHAQPQPSGSSSTNPQANRDVIETFRKLLLKQLGSPATATTAYVSEALAQAWINGLHQVDSTYQPAPFQQWINRAPNVSTYNPPDGANPNAPGISTTDLLSQAAQQQPGYRSAVYTMAGSSVEGTYVSGHGVLFLGTVHGVPQGGAGKQLGTHYQQLTCIQCHGNKVPGQEDKPSPSNQADSEWEALNGKPTPTKGQPAPKPQPKLPSYCQPSLLADRLVQLLADHGHRFTVRPDERITIQLHVRAGDQVLTRANDLFDQIGRQPQVNDGGVVVFRYPMTYSLNADAPDNYIKRNVGGPEEKFADPVAQQDANNSARDTRNALVRRQNALAELHLKEGNLDKALEAYRKIMESTDAIDPSLRAEAYRNVAVVLIKQGKVAEAQGLLANTNYTNLLTGQNNKPASAKPNQPAPKPAAQDWSLTVSATKAQCDAVRAGKLSLEDFAKQIEVKSSK